jgi:(S)-ureidoglycine aminohydrolase
MQHLGHTRSSYQTDHLLLTPDTFVRSPLPGMEKATAVVHVSPARGARFTQYTAEFEPGGVLGPSAAQRFVYVLEGSVHVAERALGANQYGYLPEGCGARVTAPDGARAAVVEKTYHRLDGVPAPAMFTASEAAVEAKALNGDPGLLVKALLPDQPAFDFAVNSMTYAPGAALPMVEMHVMEHGLLMLEGGGIYRLGDRWYPVTAGDFIWMAPWCPQWFGALGKTPAKYIVYKDWNR